MGDTTQGVTVSPDVNTVDVLRRRVKSSIGGGMSPVAALLTARFPAGVQLPGAGSGRFSTDAAAGAPGWQPVDGWRQVVAATLLANTGDFALVRLRDAAQGAMGIHIGIDNVLWIVHVRPDADPSYRRLDPSRTADLPMPACVALINYCGGVLLPVEIRGGGPGASECV